MSYRVWVDPDALREARATPGNVRQRLKQALADLQENPRPAESKTLDWPREQFEPRRLRIGNWRVIYAVNDQEQWVQVLAIRKRPPYDYGDLEKLLKSVE